VSEHDRTPIDVPAALARGLAALDALETSAAFHARVIAESLADACDAPAWSVDALLAREATTEARAHLRARLAAHHDGLVPLSTDRASGRALATSEPITVAHVLAAERSRARDALDALRRRHEERLAHDAMIPATTPTRGPATTPTPTPARSSTTSAGIDDTVLRAMLHLAMRMTRALELPALAEQTVDHHRADRVARERAYWRDLGRGVAIGVLPEGLRAATGLRPLDGRVTLCAARDPTVLHHLGSMLERAGARTLLADTYKTAATMLETFHVDAVLCMVVGATDPMMALPSVVDGLPTDRRPLVVALLTRTGSAEDGAEPPGFDATVPLDDGDAEALTVMMGLAIDARRTAHAALH
jgi:hypothetical protein